jgi:hypothetical protein
MRECRDERRKLLLNSGFLHQLGDIFAGKKVFVMIW